MMILLYIYYKIMFNLLCIHCRKAGLSQSGVCPNCRLTTDNWRELYFKMFNIKVGSGEYYDRLDKLCHICLLFNKELDKNVCSGCQE
jgi:hypothetical protein